MKGCKGVDADVGGYLSERWTGGLVGEGRRDVGQRVIDRWADVALAQLQLGGACSV